MSAGKAAQQQADAEKQAAMLQEQQYEQTRQDLLPFMTAGSSVLPQLTAWQPKAQDALTQAAAEAKGAIPGQMTEDWLKQQPSYQWNLSQGLKAMQNSAAARGLGVSGASLRGAAQWGTGLADSTYKSAWDMAQQRWSDLNQNFSNIYNQMDQGYKQLQSTASLGEDAAARSGSIGQAGAAAAGQNIAGAGQAQAAGTTAGASALAGGLQSAAQAPMNYLMYQQLFNKPSTPTVNGPQIDPANG
jgi:hypothetical protein